MDVINIMTTLKELMKSKKLTYQDLAKHLGVSLTTVKRIFSNHDVSLSRLREICQWLKCTLHDVVALSAEANIKPHKLTEAQEKFFSKNPSYLSYFYTLRKGLTPKEIENRFRLSSRSTLKYLAKLESFDLISVRNDQIKIKVLESIYWDDHGVLGRIYSKKMIGNFSNRIMKNLGASPTLFCETYTWSLNDKEYQDFKYELLNLTNRYTQLSGFNKRVSPLKEQSTVSVLTTADQWENPVDEEIIELI